MKLDPIWVVSTAGRSVMELPAGSSGKKVFTTRPQEVTGDDVIFVRNAMRQGHGTRLATAEEVAAELKLRAEEKAKAVPAPATKPPGDGKPPTDQKPTTDDTKGGAK